MSRWRFAAGRSWGSSAWSGSGRSELLETLFGLHAPHQGTIRVAGAPVRLRNPRQAARAGIALVPEERQRQGLFFNLSVRHNLMLPARTAEGRTTIATGDERRQSDALLGTWRIKAAGRDVFPDSLSGGNQQKVVLAKWLATTPKVLLLDEPTKGVDVGAKFEIHEIDAPPGGRGPRLPRRLERPAGSALALRPHPGDARGARAGRDRGP